MTDIKDLVLTLIGPDRPGLVEAVAAVIAAHDGNWLESRMARLAGHFAGILRAQLPESQVGPAAAALAKLQARGLRVLVDAAPERVDAPRARPDLSVGERLMVLEVLGLDRPGIVRDISQLLAATAVNVEELTTDRASAPMSGEMMFSARARLHVPAHVDLAGLRGGLRRLADDLVVDINLLDEPST